MAALSKLGGYTVVAAADLADVDHIINLPGPGRVNGAFGDNLEGVGKRSGMVVLVDNGSSDYDLAISTGDAAASPWRLFESSAVTPS